MEILIIPSICSLILPDNIMVVSEAHGILHHPSLFTKTGFWISVLSLEGSWWRHSGYVLRRYKIQLKNNTETSMMTLCVMEKKMKNRDNFVLIFRCWWEWINIMEIKSIFMGFNGDKHFPGVCCGKQSGNSLSLILCDNTGWEVIVSIKRKREEEGWGEKNL